MPRLTTIFFDLGNTLIYSQADWVQVMRAAVTVLFEHLPGVQQEHRHDHLPDQFLAHLYAYMEQREIDLIETTTRQLLADFLSQSGAPAPGGNELQSAIDAMYAHTQQYWHLEQDAVPTLSRLRERGYRLAVISNAMDEGNTQALIDKGRLRGFFEVILSSAVAGVRKPHQRIFNRVLQEMAVTARQAVMVGDTLNADILGAQRIGLQDIWITRRAETPGNRADLARIQPTASVRTLDELPDLIETLQPAAG